MFCNPVALPFVHPILRNREQLRSVRDRRRHCFERAFLNDRQSESLRVRLQCFVDLTSTILVFTVPCFQLSTRLPNILPSKRVQRGVRAFVKVDDTIDPKRRRNQCFQPMQKSMNQPQDLPSILATFEFLFRDIGARNGTFHAV